MNVYLRTRTLKSGRLSYYLDYYIDGRRTVKALGLSAPANPRSALERGQAAEIAAIARRKHAEAYSGAANGIIPGRASGATVAEYCKLIADTKQKASTQWNWKHLHKHLQACGIGKILLAKITTADCSKFRTYLSTTFQESTAAVLLSSFRTLLRQAHNDEIITRDLSAKLKPIKRNRSEVEYLTQQEFDALISTPIAYREIRRAFAFSCMTGMRFSDIKELTWDKIHDGEPGELSVIRYAIIKTGRAHEIYLDDQTREWLGERRRGNVFTLPSQQTVNAAIDKWAKSAGIRKKVRYHVSRHTYGTLALLKLGNLKLVSERMGHTTTAQTEVYARIIDTQRRQAAGAVKTSAPMELPEFKKAE